MKLRKPCLHNQYDWHEIWGSADEECPGGVFLPDDTLVVEKVDGKWPEWAKAVLHEHDQAPYLTSEDLEKVFDDLVIRALFVREAE